MVATAVRKLKQVTALRVLDQFQQSIVDFKRGLRYAKRLPSVGSGPFADRLITPLEVYFDDVTEGAALWKWRHYFEIYERHLSRFRGQHVRVLEIGVLGGGSLTMWREYFGHSCQIYGVDIDPSAVAHETDGIGIFIGDQSDPEFWRRVLGAVPEFDVVLDDGGHRAHQQIATFEALLPHIAPGGIYVCEDIHGSMHAFHAYIDGFTRPLSAIPPPHGQIPASTLHEHVASVHRYPLLTVVEKPAHAVSYFEAPLHGNEWPSQTPSQLPSGRGEALTKWLRRDARR